ncbi:MAG: hypothetical protein ACTSUF_09750 [Candidatus Heimdallarchaeaceae archaeon]
MDEVIGIKALKTYQDTWMVYLLVKQNRGRTTWDFWREHSDLKLLGKALLKIPELRIERRDDKEKEVEV